MRLLAAALAVMTFTVGACASDDNAGGGEDEFPRYGTTPVGGEGVTVEVFPGASITVPAGAVAEGSVRISEVQADLPDTEWFIPERVAVDLEVTGELTTPAQVRFAGEAPEGSLAAILHYESVTGWVAVAVGEPGEDAVLDTTTFSAHLFGFIPIPDWLRTGADSVSGAVRTLFDKRAPGPTCEAAPDWTDHSPASIDAVLSCVAPATDEETGTPEAELRLVNNRGYAIEVGVPSAARYVWVNGQPEPIRAAVRSLAGGDVVWLLPGQLMTVGLSRPDVGEVIEVPARVTAQTVLIGYLEDALAEDLGPLGVVHVLGQCNAWNDLLLDLSPVDASLISVFTVAKDCFTALAADHVRLLTISNAIRGQNSTAAQVSRLAGTLRVAAGAIAAVDRGADLIDLVADDYVNPATAGPDGYATIVGLRPQLDADEQAFRQLLDAINTGDTDTIARLSSGEVPRVANGEELRPANEDACRTAIEGSTNDRDCYAHTSASAETFLFLMNENDDGSWFAADYVLLGGL